MSDNVRDIHEEFKKYSATDSGKQYLANLIQKKDPFAYLAAAVLGSLPKFGAEKNVPTSTVADKITGIPSVAQQQNNQDPRFLTGVGGMDARRMSNVNAAEQGGIMNAAAGGFVGYQDGGIVGYQEGGETKTPDVNENMIQKGFSWVKNNPDKAANYAGLGLMFIPGVGLLGRAALYGARSKLGAKTAGMLKNYFTKPGQQKIVGGPKFPTKTPNLPAVVRNPGARSLRYGPTAFTTGLGLTGLGALLGDSPEEAKPKTEPPFDPPKKQEDKGFLASLPRSAFRQLQLTGGILSQDASNQNILGKTLGAYGKAAAVQGAEEQKQEDAMAQLAQKGINTLAAKEYVSVADRAKASKETREYGESTQFQTDIENIYAGKEPYELQALYGGVDEQGIKDAIAAFLIQQKELEILGRAGSYDSAGWGNVEELDS
jgi:hypothetical protein